MNQTLLFNVTAVAIHGRGLLIEGDPGSGKTSLALALIDRGATLIGDDGVLTSETAAGIVLLPPPQTCGLVEVRNVGLVRLPVATAPLALALSLHDNAPRFVDAATSRTIGAHAIPALSFRPGDAIQALRAEYALDKFGLPLATLASVARMDGA